MAVDDRGTGTRESGSSTSESTGAGATTERRARRVRHELLLSLELVALATFAFSRPVLDSFGRSPEAFLLRGVAGRAVVAFGVVVAVAPALVSALIGLVARTLGGRRGATVHAALVGVLGAIAAWRLGRDVTEWPGRAAALLLGGAVAGVLLVVVRRRSPSSGTFLRIAGASSVLFLAQFLFLSPASSLVFGVSATTTEVPAAAIADQLGDDPPNVLFITFDALPLVSLLDGSGQIDADLYPHFAALAAESTWYRNHTTVAGYTLDAVPAMLAGRYPHTMESGIFGSPHAADNIFTLLGDSYDMQINEEVTGMCPREVCHVGPSGDLGALFGDAIDLWSDTSPAPKAFLGMPTIGFDHVFEDVEDRIDHLDVAAGDRPRFVFDHVLLPHPPWRVLDDGTPYQVRTPTVGAQLDGSWGATGTAVAEQRHILQTQAADALLGRYLDAFRAAGTYDDTLVVVTSDHGKSFLPDDHSRALSADNADQIMWTPLMIKEPRQSAGRVDDGDVRSIDIVPTIADVLGVDPYWPVDGQPAHAATSRDGSTKPFLDNQRNRLRADDGEPLVQVDAAAPFDRVLAADRVPSSGPDAVWKRAEHGDLFGQPVAEASIGEPSAADIAVRGLAALDVAAVDEPLPLELVGTSDLPATTVVAYALNGTIGAVTTVEETGDDARLVHGLLPPHLFTEGANELTAYVVDGPAGDPVLHPVTVVDGGA